MTFKIDVLETLILLFLNLIDSLDDERLVDELMMVFSKVTIIVVQSVNGFSVEDRKRLIHNATVRKIVLIIFFDSHQSHFPRAAG